MCGWCREVAAAAYSERPTGGRCASAQSHCNSPSCAIEAQRQAVPPCLVRKALPAAQRCKSIASRLGPKWQMVFWQAKRSPRHPEASHRSSRGHRDHHPGSGNDIYLHGSVPVSHAIFVVVATRQRTSTDFCPSSYSRLAGDCSTCPREQSIGGPRQAM